MGCAVSASPRATGAVEETEAHAAPISADWAYTDISSIFTLLQPQASGKPPPVRLLDSVWLLERASKLALATEDAQREALALPSRQDLERSHPEAFLSIEQVRELDVHDSAHGYWQPTGAIAVGSISHAWLTPHHPDPLGQQLVKLGAVLQSAKGKKLPRQQTGWDATAPRRHGYVALPARCGIFYGECNTRPDRSPRPHPCSLLRGRPVFPSRLVDWCSLCQSRKAPDGTVLVERTHDEREAFSLALDSMQIWYAHQKLFAILVTELPDGCIVLPYDARGWPTVERAWTMLSKPNNMSCWPMIYEVGSASGETRRAPPMHPDRLNTVLDTKRFTSESADRPLVERLYYETTASVLAEAEKLSFGEAGWTDLDFAALAEVLPMCTRCDRLNLGRNACRDAGVAAIAEVAKRDATLRSLRVLALNDNQLGDSGLEAIAEAARAGAFPALGKLFLMNNHIGSSGCSALASALRAGAMPGLREVRLSGNAEATGIDTPMCRFWAAGKCNKGAECVFRHEPDPEKPGAWAELEQACQAREPAVSLWRHERKVEWGTGGEV